MAMVSVAITVAVAVAITVSVAAPVIAMWPTVIDGLRVVSRRWLHINRPWLVINRRWRLVNHLGLYIHRLRLHVNRLGLHINRLLPVPGLLLVNRVTAADIAKTNRQRHVTARFGVGGK